MNKRDKRIHGQAAAVGGDAGAVEELEPVGPCPSCCALLRYCQAVDPRTGQDVLALTHPMPFCSYFGETSPEEIERDVFSRRRV